MSLADEGWQYYVNEGMTKIRPVSVSIDTCV